MPAMRKGKSSTASRERKRLKERAREDETLAEAAADPAAKRRLRKQASEARKLAGAVK